MTERRAPVQGGHGRGREIVPPGTIAWWEHEEVWRAYAELYGREQSAERIAERGGFGKHEAEKLLRGPLATWEAWR